MSDIEDQQIMSDINAYYKSLTRGAFKKHTNALAMVLVLGSLAASQLVWPLTTLGDDYNFVNDDYNYVESGSISISKTVKNVTAGQSVYSDSVNANYGDTVRFNILLQNTGDFSLSRVIVRDPLPAGLEYVVATINTSNGSVTSVSDFFNNSGINIGSLPAGRTAYIVFDAKVTTTSSITLANVAYVKASQVSEKDDSATVYVSSNAVTSVASGLTKTVANLNRSNGTNTSNYAFVGDTLEYTSSYMNNTSGTLSNVYIYDTLPSCTSFVSAANSGSYNTGNNQITWNVGSLAAGATVPVSYQVSVLSVPQNQTVIENQSLLTSTETSQVVSNTVYTTVYLTTPVKTVTGVNSLTGNIIFSSLLGILAAAMLYFGLRYTDALRMLKLKWAVLRIRAKENQA